MYQSPMLMPAGSPERESTQMNSPQEATSQKRRVGRPRIHIPPELIRNLREQGLSFRKIAVLTGFGYGSVRRAWKSYSGPSGPTSGAFL